MVSGGGIFPMAMKPAVSDRSIDVTLLTALLTKLLDPDRRIEIDCTSESCSMQKEIIIDSSKVKTYRAEKRPGEILTLFTSP